MIEVYYCRDRAGLVHAATPPWYENKYPVDEPFCGQVNYMTRTTDMVTCIQCLSVLFRLEQEENGT